MISGTNAQLHGSGAVDRGASSPTAHGGGPGGHQRTVRLLLVVGGLGALAYGMALLLGVEAATRAWLWPSASRLSLVFASSIAAALAAAVVWIGWRGPLSALRAGGLNIAPVFAAVAVYLAAVAAERPDAVRYRLYALLFAGIALSAAAAYAYGRRFPYRLDRPTPRVAVASFAVFGVVLTLVGALLVARAPHVFPWPLTPDQSVVYGAIFLGAAVYFAYAVLRPYWDNAGGQLIGFLAYDLVLIGPFLRHWGAVAEPHAVSLTIYLAVVIYSGALALYYLVLRPPYTAQPGPSPP